MKRSGVLVNVCVKVTRRGVFGGSTLEDGTCAQLSWIPPSDRSISMAAVAQNILAVTVPHNLEYVFLMFFCASF
jgi:hypothetical protein